MPKNSGDFMTPTPDKSAKAERPTKPPVWNPLDHKIYGVGLLVSAVAYNKLDGYCDTLESKLKALTEGSGVFSPRQQALEEVAKAARKAVDWELPLDREYADCPDIEGDFKRLRDAVIELDALKEATP